MFIGCFKLKRYFFKNSVKKLGESSISSLLIKGLIVIVKDKIVWFWGWWIYLCYECYFCLFFDDFVGMLLKNK